MKTSTQNALGFVIKETKIRILSPLLTLFLMAVTPRAIGQAPVINSLSQNGQLFCSGLQNGSQASVEWAPSPAGPWHTNWAGLEAVLVGTNGTISLNVPMFFRVRGVPPAVITNGMALIPAGDFLMGDPFGYPYVPLNITVSAFYMDVNLVSLGQWQTVYTYAITHGYSFTLAGSSFATNHPVEDVNWFDCVKWSNARSVQAGLMPCYYTDAELTKVYTNGEGTVYMNLTNNGYRLPTEAEWEKAARGGLTGQLYPWGNTISEAQANYYYDGTLPRDLDLGPGGNPIAVQLGSHTTPVGSFPPNAYGLYDMAGNVMEWCWNWLSGDNGIPTQTDPTGPSTGDIKVLRGGSWERWAITAQCGVRFALGGYPTPSDATDEIGFRCVRRP